MYRLTYPLTFVALISIAAGLSTPVVGKTRHRPPSVSISIQDRYCLQGKPWATRAIASSPRMANAWPPHQAHSHIALSTQLTPFGSGRVTDDPFGGAGTDDHRVLALRPAKTSSLLKSGCDQYGLAKHMADSPEAVILHSSHDLYLQ